MFISFEGNPELADTERSIKYSWISELICIDKNGKAAIDDIESQDSTI